MHKKSEGYKEQICESFVGDYNITENDKKCVADHIFCALNTDILKVDSELK